MSTPLWHDEPCPTCGCDACDCADKGLTIVLSRPQELLAQALHRWDEDDLDGKDCDESCDEQSSWSLERAEFALSSLSAAGFELLPTALVDAVVAHEHGSRCQNCLQNALAFAAYRRAPVLLGQTEETLR